MNDPMRLPYNADCLCRDSRPCFAKALFPSTTFKTGFMAKCRLLKTSYRDDGECPFCKPRREVTRGVVYPYDYNYTSSAVQTGGNA